MKKFSFISLMFTFLLLEVDICSAQTVINFLRTEKIKIQAFKIYKKKSSQYLSLPVSIKMGVNAGNLFSNKYTVDSIDLRSLQSGTPGDPLFHYKYYPSFNIDVSATYKIYLLYQTVSIETGLDFTKKEFSIEKVEGSHTGPGFSNIIKRKEIGSEIRLPLFLSLEKNTGLLRIGIVTPIYRWGYTKTFTNDIGIVISRGKGISLLNYREYYPVISYSQAILNKKIKISPFVAIEIIRKVATFYHLGLEFTFNKKNHDYEKDY